MSELGDMQSHENQGVTDRLKTGVHDAKVKVHEMGESARNRAHDIGESARTHGAERLENNPLALVAGGIVIGAVIGALLPRTMREKAVAGGAGRAINTRVKEAASVARQVGADKAKELGLTGDTAKEQVKGLFGKAAEAARAAAAEAGKTVASKPAPSPDAAAGSAPSGIPGGSGAAPAGATDEALAAATTPPAGTGSAPV